MILRLLIIIFILSLGSIPQSVFADLLDVNLNNNAAQFKYIPSVRSMVKGDSEFSVGALYNDSKNIFVDSEILVRGENGSVRGLTLGVGVKALAGSIHSGALSNSMLAIAIGGEIGYTIPTARQIALVGEYFASPRITTFGDAERFNQSGARVEYEIIPQTKAYIGYREISIGNATYGGVVLDSGWHVGVRLAF